MNATVEETVRFATHIEDSAGAPTDGSHAGSVYRARGARGREACELTGTTTRSLEFPLDADVDIEKQTPCESVRSEERERGVEYAVESIESERRIV